ncbi:MAG: hypothetical protein HQM15_00365 [Deltaproteobacteria bacterium]|nr:hypothetical protein [Deltaproteobacteria bacterium]
MENQNIMANPMSEYGLSFDSINRVLTASKQLTPSGYELDIVSESEFCLRQLNLIPHKSTQLKLYRSVNGAIFVEEGLVVLKIIEKDGNTKWHLLKKGDVFQIPKMIAHSLYSFEKSVVYFFGDSASKEDVYCLEPAPSSVKLQVEDFSEKKTEVNIKHTFDYREKYWGSIESILSDDYAAKRIVLKAGSRGSMEFHCKKKEAYFLQSGLVKVGVRVGRAENKSLILNPGDAFVIPVGLMHCRMGLEDSVIIEVSTKDDDKDSHLVEDGNTYQHVDS